MVKIVLSANQKGRVRKIAIAITLANALRYCGYKVLIIDADSQCNTTIVPKTGHSNILIIISIAVTITSIWLAKKLIK